MRHTGVQPNRPTSHHKTPRPKYEEFGLWSRISLGKWERLWEKKMHKKVRSYCQPVCLLNSFANKFQSFLFVCFSQHSTSLNFFAIDLSLGYLYSLGKRFQLYNIDILKNKTHPLAYIQSFWNCYVKVFYVPKLLPVLNRLKQHDFIFREFIISLPR